MLINSQNVCFTTTAMPRPELLEKTYDSFSKHIKWLDFKKIKLIINVDTPRMGFEDLQQRYDRINKVCNKYFGEVAINISNQGNFPDAVKWVFSQVDTDFAINLEDDWELLCDLPVYICDFFTNKNIKQVGIRGSRNSVPRFVLSPSIMRADFCHFISRSLNRNKNPEQQIRDITKNRAEEFFAYWPYEDNKVMIRDLGRAWMQQTQYAGGFDSWTSWRHIANPIRRVIEQKYIDQNVEIDINALDGNYRRPNAPSN